jgi:hypothetical protein
LTAPTRANTTPPSGEHAPHTNLETTVTDAGTDPSTANVHADRLPTDEELHRQSSNTRDSFTTGDLVLAPATWGTAVFIIDATHANHDGTVQLGIATRGPDGAIRIDRGIGGAARSTALVRVCRYCLKIDPLNHHLLGCDAPQPDDQPAPVTVPVTITDISGHGATAVIHVDTDTEDAMVIIDVAGLDLVGIDLNAGTVGVWTGDPDDRTWHVVDRFTSPPPHAQPSGNAAPVDARPPASAAEQAFAVLTANQRGRLLRRVFETLEYDEDHQPGGEWSSDTTQALDNLFRQFGIVFTAAEPEECDGGADHGAFDRVDTVKPGGRDLTWASTNPDQPARQTAPSRITLRIRGTATHYAVWPTDDGRWRADLVITDCGHDVPAAGTHLGDFDNEDDAKAAAALHEINNT